MREKSTARNQEFYITQMRRRCSERATKSILLSSQSAKKDVHDNDLRRDKKAYYSSDCVSISQ
jgi:hypothetical protein